VAQPIQFTYNIAAASTQLFVNAIASGVVKFTLNTTVMPAGTSQQRLILTVTGNEAANTFRIVGTNLAGFPISETVTGVNNSTVLTNQDFFTVTGFTAGSSTAGTTSLGTNNYGSTLWYIVNQNAAPTNMEVSGVVTSSSTAVTWGYQYTYDDPNATISPNPALNQNPATCAAFNHPTLNAVAGTTSLDGPINDPVFAIRMLISSGTGVVRGTIMQSGLGSP